MNFREFGKTGIMLSGVGMGMNRLPVQSIDDEKGIQKAADLVVYALQNGINYIDVARNYSNGTAYPIVRHALEKVSNIDDIHICIKMMLYHTDKTKEGALQNIREQLKDLNLASVDFCFAQAVKSYEEYQEIMRPGGIYEGFLEAREQGLIRHLCLSSHATVEETILIMEEGAFEGMTVSYHLLNCMQMQPVLDKAREIGMGILTMNSLAGGLIPQNPQLFQERDNEQICRQAIQYIYGHPEVTCVLLGMQSKEEVDCNIDAIEKQEEYEQIQKEQLTSNLFQRNGLCTGCDYCRGCPKEIPIKSFMYSYNALQFNNSMYAGQYKRADRDLLGDIRLAQEMMRNGIEFPIMEENPCIGCRSCERKCTQSLPIVERIQNIYNKINKCILGKGQLRRRLQELILPEYKKIAFYPNCATTRKIIAEYCDLIGTPEYDIYIIDKNEESWGKHIYSDIEVEIIGLEKVPDIKPQCIIVTHYILEDLLYHNVEKYIKEGIDVRFIYREEDVPIVYLGG